MDFDLSGDQVALRDAARELLDARSSTERVRKLFDSTDKYDADLWREMAEQGWLAIDVAEDEGGLGLGFVEVAVLAEEVGRHVTPAPYLSTVLARHALAGTDWAQRLTAGDTIGAIAWGDGVVVDAAIADVLVVVQPDAVTAYDITASRPVAEAAMDLTRPVSKLMALTGGERVGGADLATALLDRGATAYAAELLGAAQRMLEATVEYAKVREQFGRPIGSFQAVKHRCADMLVDVEGMRSAVWYAAWAIDADAEDRSLAASTAKAWASDAGMRVMNSALQVHGGIGFTWEHDLHLYLKRAHLDAMLFGDASYHRERIATLLKARIESGAGVFEGELLAAGGLLVGAGLIALSVAPATAGPAAPSFKTQLLPGTSGFSEPRASVLANRDRYLDTNATDGTEAIFHSSDGLHWTKTTSPPQQTITTTDVDIVTTRTGRVIASELDYAGINFRTAYSDDHGKTWTESNGTTYADTDRQWFAVGPDDPTTHKPRVYLLFHDLLTGVLSHNMFVATSKDGGATFGPPIPVAVPGQQDWLDLQCADSGGPSNIFTDARTGRVFVVFGTRSSPVGGCGAQPVEVNVVAANRVWVVEAPASATATLGGWHPHLAVNDTGPPAHITGMQLAPGAIDTAGNVYVAYPESINDYPDYNGAAIKVIHASSASLDSWSKPTVVAPSGGPGNVLPHIVAGASGKVDVAWYHGVAGPKNTILWYSMAAQSLDALSSSPHWQSVRLSNVLAEPTDQDSSALMGACLQGQQATLNGFYCGRAADVYGIALDSCGSLLVTWPAQAGLKSDGTYVAQQTGGPTVLPCKAAGVTQPQTEPTATHPSTSPGLAATGASPLAAVGGTALLAVSLFGVFVVRRRRHG